MSHKSSGLGSPRVEDFEIDLKATCKELLQGGVFSYCRSEIAPNQISPPCRRMNKNVTSPDGMCLAFRKFSTLSLFFPLCPVSEEN